MDVTPASPEQIQSRVAAIRRYRRLAYVCILAPVVFIIAIVALNRLTNGGMHVLVSGEPWTRALWFGIFGIFCTGCLVLVMNLGRQCPRCGESLFVKKHYRRSTTGRTGRGGVNVFARQCVNCKLPLA